MSKYYQMAKQEAFRRLPETCPSVRTHLNEIFHRNGLPIHLVNECMEVVGKYGTTPLRETLADAIGREMTLKDQYTELQNTL